MPASTDLVNPEHLSSSALPWGVGWASASPGEGQQGKGQPPEQARGGSVHVRTLSGYSGQKWVRGWGKSERDTLVMLREISGSGT